MAEKPANILDIKHSIKDDNVVAPESFETQTRDLEANFFLKNYTRRAETTAEKHSTGTPEEYEKLLSQLPTEIEMPYNSIVGRFIDMYLGKRRTLVADMLALHNYYGKIFVEELERQNMPLELQYLPVIESALNPNAVSRAGATGLWQFMPATAMGLGLEVNSLVDQRRDPRSSTRAAVRYLKQLHSIYGDWSLAIAAYNCGPGNVNKALRRAGGGTKDFWEIYTYLPQETRGYVPAFIAANFVMNYYDKFGLNPTLVSQQLVADTVQVNNRVHFSQISEVLNIPVDEIKMLNPQYRKDVIPGDSHPYSLVLPSQQVLSYIMSEEAILALNADQLARRTTVEPGEIHTTSKAEQKQMAQTQPRKTMHTVARGENLRGIAKKYGVSATDIRRWNNMASSKVRAGQVLTIEIWTPEMAQETAQAESDTTTTTTDNAEPQTVEIASSGNKNAKQQANATPANKKPAAEAKKQTPAKQKAKASTTTYTVRKGDTLSKIASRHGTTVKAIQQANGMGNKTRVDIGQKLKIPTKK